MLFSSDRNPPKYPPSKEQISERQSKYEDTKNWAIENGVVSREESDLIEDYAERRAEDLYNKFMSSESVLIDIESDSPLSLVTVNSTSKLPGVRKR
jgi:hypothetical protein